MAKITQPRFSGPAYMFYLLGLLLSPSVEMLWFMRRVIGAKQVCSKHKVEGRGREEDRKSNPRHWMTGTWTSWVVLPAGTAKPRMPVLLGSKFLSRWHDGVFCLFLSTQLCG